MKKFILKMFEEKIYGKENFHKFLEACFQIFEVFKKAQMNTNSYKILFNSLKYAKVFIKDLKFSTLN